MRLSTLRIQNLRSIAEATVHLDPYTCLVGPNGAGKSTVLTALNILFRYTNDSPTDLVNLTEQDFHKGNTDNPITISAHFTDLEPEAELDFKHYVRQGILVVSARATWDAGSRRATVKQFGQRLVMKVFAPFFKAAAEGKAVTDLKVTYGQINQQFPNLPAEKTKQAMIDALRTYEEAHPSACEFEESDDEFYGVSKGKNLLQKYIQWVHVPAVKDATSEQIEGKKTALGLLLERVVRTKVSFKQELEEIKTDAQAKYAKLLGDQAQVLKVLSDALNSRLQHWAHPDACLSLAWREHPEAVKVEEPLAHILAGEGAILADLARCGHGLQRSYLLALLHELASLDAANAPRLILGCEEPELYQHPPQQRYLAEVLERLTEGNAQVIVSTHSPYFVSGRGFEAVRMVRKDPALHATRITMARIDQVASTISKVNSEIMTASALPPRLQQLLQPSINEMFFAPIVVFVEGLEDAAYLSTYMTLLGLWDDYRRLGCHIVPVNGKSHLVRCVAIAKHLEIPAFVIFDADGHESNTDRLNAHKRDNLGILDLCGHKGADPLPKSPFWGHDVVVWPAEIGETVLNELGPNRAEKLRSEVMAQHKFYAPGSLEKNGIFIGHVLCEAWKRDLRSSSLEKACMSVLTFARGSGDLAAAAAA